MQETGVRSLGWEDPLEKEMATHSSVLAWRIPWTEEPGGLQSMGSQSVRHDRVTDTYTPDTHVTLTYTPDTRVTLTYTPDTHVRLPSGFILRSRDVVGPLRCRKKMKSRS